MADARGEGRARPHRRRARRAAPGYFYPPTVLADVDHTHALMREETFGPVLPIMAVRLARRGDPPRQRQPLRPHRQRLDAQRGDGATAPARARWPASSRSTTTSPASASRTRPGAASSGAGSAAPTALAGLREMVQAEVREPRPRPRRRAVVVSLRRRVRAALMSRRAPALYAHRRCRAPARRGQLGLMRFARASGGASAAWRAARATSTSCF